MVAVAKLMAAAKRPESGPALQMLLSQRPEGAPRVAERLMTRALVPPPPFPASPLLPETAAGSWDPLGSLALLDMAAAASGPSPIDCAVP